MSRKSLRFCIAVFLTAMFLCPSFGMMSIPTQITGTASADYVDASHDANESDIEDDPLVPGWSKDVRLTNDDTASDHPDIAIDSAGGIHVVWQNGGEENWEIRYIRSFDKGRNWSESIILNDPPQEGGNNPSITTSQNTTHCVWWSYVGTLQKSDIRYTKSLNLGESWEQVVKLTDATGNAYGARIVADSSVLHAVWSDERDENFEIYYKRSLDGGDNWEDDVRLTKALGKSQSPELAVDSWGGVHIVWEDSRDGNTQIYYKRSLDGGDNWSEDIRLTHTTYDTDDPILAIDSNDNIHVAWADYRSQHIREDIFYKRSTNKGDTWSDDINITKQSYADSFAPYILADLSGGTFLVWKTSNRTDGSNDLYYTEEEITGNAWGSLSRLTHAVNGTRLYPKVDVDSSNILHLVWFDDRHGFSQNTEIYYKRTLKAISSLPINVSQFLNQTSCKPGNSITVSGNAVYNNAPVPNANVTIKLLEVGEEWNTTTAVNGDYELDITAPTSPGNYTVRVKVVWGNHTGWSLKRLTVEEEVITDGGNGEGVNGEGEEERAEGGLKINPLYLVVIGVVVAGILVGVGLLRIKEPREEAGVVERPKIKLRCSSCKEVFEVEKQEKPFKVKCPFCGKEGAIR